MAYFPDPRRVVIRTENIAGSELHGWWFNPRTGQATGLGTLAMSSDCLHAAHNGAG